jgi:thioredoxin-like negative regulator of GroEL
MSEII